MTLNGTYKSIQKLLLFNMFLCDLFQFCPDLDNVNYADDKTPHPTNKTLNFKFKNFNFKNSRFIRSRKRFEYFNQSVY